MPDLSSTSRPAPRRELVNYGVAALAVAGAAAVRFALSGLLDNRLPYLTFFAAVAFTAYRGGWWPGLFATALSTLICLTIFPDNTAWVYPDAPFVIRLGL